MQVEAKIPRPEADSEGPQGARLVTAAVTEHREEPQAPLVADPEAASSIPDISLDVVHGASQGLLQQVSTIAIAVGYAQGRLTAHRLR